MASDSSALRDGIGSESGIDIKVKFTPGRAPGLLGMAGIEIGLAASFGDSRMNLRTREDLSR